MYRTLIIFLVFLLMACSKNAENPEINETPDPPAPEDVGSGEEQGIPFSLSVLLREYTGVSNEVDYHQVDFIKGRNQGYDPLNITQRVGLQGKAGFLKNGKETILVFIQSPEELYVTYDILSGESRSAAYSELFPGGNDCSFPSNLISWNNSRAFTFKYYGCPDLRSLRLLSRDLESGEVTQLPILENAYTGDSAHRIWVTDDYFLVHYDDRGPDADLLIREGLIVYDAQSLEEVFATNSPTIKSIYIDGDKLLIASRLEDVELIDLRSPREVIQKTPNPSFTQNERIGNASIYQGKIGTFLAEGPHMFPAYYDSNANEYLSVDRDAFLTFFNRDTIDFTADVLRPEEYKFDMETETFAITYLIFSPGESRPKASAIVFMDFGGNVLFHQEFPGPPFEVVTMAKH